MRGWPLLALDEVSNLVTSTFLYSSVCAILGSIRRRNRRIVGLSLVMGGDMELLKLTL